MRIDAVISTMYLTQCLACKKLSHIVALLITCLSEFSRKDGMKSGHDLITELGIKPEEIMIFVRKIEVGSMNDAV